MPRVVISGYYGFDNAGDEAVLAAIIEGLRQQQPDIEITVFSADKAKTSRAHKVDAVNRNSIFDMLAAISKADLLISGGGSLLQDVTSKLSVYYYLGVIVLAKLLGKPVMLYAQGIGPLVGKWSRFFVRLICNRANLITLRDEESAKLLKEIGIKQSLMQVTADPVFILQPAAEERIEEILKAEGINLENGCVGISIRHWQDSTIFREIAARVADYLIDTYGLNVVFLPMQLPSDLEESKLVQQMMKNEAKVIKGIYSVREIIGLISKMKLIIGMRLHSLIFSAVTLTPFVGISYDPKVDSFLKLMGQPTTEDAQKIQLVEILEQVDRILASPEDFRNTISTRVQELKGNVLWNNQLALELVGKGEMNLGREGKNT